MNIQLWIHFLPHLIWFLPFILTAVSLNRSSDCTDGNPEDAPLWLGLVRLRSLHNLMRKHLNHCYHTWECAWIDSLTMVVHRLNYGTLATSPRTILKVPNSKTVKRCHFRAICYNAKHNHKAIFYFSELWKKQKRIESYMIPWMLFDSRGGAFMSTVLAWLTLWKTKNKKSSVVLSWFSGTPYTVTQQNRSDKMHHSQRPPANWGLRSRRT
jgi:hypothetical protein